MLDHLQTKAVQFNIIYCPIHFALARNERQFVSVAFCYIDVTYIENVKLLASFISNLGELQYELFIVLKNE